MTSIAFLGLGAIGRPIAACIANSGAELTVTGNRTSARSREIRLHIQED